MSNLKKDVMDGNTAAAYISYPFTEVAGIFPITPSSPMAEMVDQWAADGRKNCFGEPVRVVEMQSEGGAAGTVHGSLQSGALTTTYTASQGLLLMIPNMYKIAGEFLPGVFHVSARTLSVHALSIFGDHSDVMGCRMTGFAMLASSSPQEVMDMGAVSHLSAIKGSLPFLHFFDGFRTSHELQKIDILDYDAMSKLIDREALAAFRKKANNPEHPFTRGTTVNPDIFFQTREAGNDYFEKLPGIVLHYMEEINKITGRDYKLFNYYGAPDAEDVIIAMASVCDTAREVVEALCAQGKKVGLVQVHLYRPFSAEHFLAALPKTTKRIACLDRTKEPGGMGEPLYQDVVNVLSSRKAAKAQSIEVVGGRYGLSSKDTTPEQIAAVFKNLAVGAGSSGIPKNNFTIGINDDVYHSSLEPVKLGAFAPLREVKSFKIWGLGSDGTVGANKNSIKIIGENTDFYTQCYFVYDSKKSGGLTQSHLRISPKPILSTYLVTEAEFVACHTQAYVDKYNMTRDLKEGGIFLLNCRWQTAEELDKALPAEMKKGLADKKAQLYVINAIDIARDLGLGNRTNTVLQAAFFKLTNIIPIDLAVKEMKDFNHKSYFIKRGQAVVDMNNKAVDAGLENLVKIEIPAAWAAGRGVARNAPVDASRAVPPFITDIVDVMNRQEGDDLPVSVLKKYGTADGSWPAGTSQYEKRGVAVDVPEWIPENCIQCNRCSYVCPHAAIRPVLMNEAEQKAAPEGFVSKKAIGLPKTADGNAPEYAFRMQVSPMDCMGCGSCALLCPAKEKALVMKPFETQTKEADNWMYAVDKVTIKKDAFSSKNVKLSQFSKPYFEFSGACAGCAETPYIKLVTQLFGRKAYITNASGCSSAYGGSTPSSPYTVDKQGHGPTWAMSLFEDNAEYAYGFFLGHEAIKEELVGKIKTLAEAGVAKAECEAYLAVKDDFDQSDAATEALLHALSSPPPAPPASGRGDDISYILAHREYLTKKSVWAFGGDGWAYDIGYGGLDHVLASGHDVNVLVLDTEVYSNTGGQASKATPTGAAAKFAAAGKPVKKKDLGLMAMSYGYIYVAQVAMGADYEQTLKALREAESYPGPSIVICYCPCIEHGLKRGQGKSMEEMKAAVEDGYWHLYRYDPRLAEEGKNPFQLDSKPPTGSVLEFMKGESRFNSLALAHPDRAKALFAKAEKDAAERYKKYLDLSGKL
ncbi:MAG: pyruvate:ferredoxin (flavodoxin) oxidoreductase [Spirochaetaceae bacterium]|jgi:pyruvate-ferredoxin/flavodoxin oxidoreductase|nr:pyruvate:ferredoxin (flavodoxin) oxidoreductase [Spirochaetaceae bacterium]